jgi:putative chitinase
MNLSDLNFKALTGLIPQHVLMQLPDTASKFNITSNLRLAHFLAQCALESANFSITEENLNYSAKRLKEIFPRYFPENLADLYANQPVKIGSRVYANRLGNGDEESREGYIYRGRGYIQLTGKNNYKLFSKFIGEDCVKNPDLVATKYPLASAAYFFNSNNLWVICDRGDTDEVVTAVTKKVNGGLHGLSERISYFKKFYTALIR